MSVQATLTKIGDLVAAVSGIARVYVAGENGVRGIPDAINEWPAVILVPSLGNPQHLPQHQHHDYSVVLYLLCGGADKPSALNKVVPFIDSLLTVWIANKRLGGIVEYITPAGWDQVGELTFGGGTYQGFRMVVNVREHANVTFGVGA